MTDGSGDYHMEYNNEMPTVWALCLAELAFLEWVKVCQE